MFRDCLKQVAQNYGTDCSQVLSANEYVTGEKNVQRENARHRLLACQQPWRDFPILEERAVYRATNLAPTSLLICGSPFTIGQIKPRISKSIV